ncbi:hypothetical protein JKP88DRAFT_279503 [Tribonema minus]|uniref:Uncharacterized protein n=1 Tax=Tribonema minus TaxID=303371 RepID=A0A835YS92_9STRA|nr:hypothetical protein JKP88DRAFT_279503 [Tribonema minus]
MSHSSRTPEGPRQRALLQQETHATLEQPSEGFGHHDDIFKLIVSYRAARAVGGETLDTSVIEARASKLQEQELSGLKSASELHKESAISFGETVSTILKKGSCMSVYDDDDKINQIVHEYQTARGQLQSSTDMADAAFAKWCESVTARTAQVDEVTKGGNRKRKRDDVEEVSGTDVIRSATKYMRTKARDWMRMNGGGMAARTFSIA